ncbi:MAG: hypothetical protein M0P69_03635 [Bacteroidales bacterium]|nr:hypothetical protein [Bacteroidales bacterium]
MKVISVVKGAWGCGKKEALEILDYQGATEFADKTVKRVGVLRDGSLNKDVWKIVDEEVYFVDDGPRPVFMSKAPGGMVKKKF